MVERNTDIQYDDDLTVGADDYDESLYDGDVDLFEYVGEEESAITRLKTIILSIDWEITDAILRELNEELHELRDIWYNEKINLVYIQALDKLSKYIYQERADANPTSIKLLLTFYTNLEKIVLENDLTEEAKTKILMEDVKRYERFKAQIGVSKKNEQDPTTETNLAEQAESLPSDDISESDHSSMLLGDSEDILLNLKAIVYGIDWEITDKELTKLEHEVEILKNKFSTDKISIHFLQGIGSLGNYISIKKSDSNADAFQLLHSFFAGLERIVKEDLSYEEQKHILLEKVEHFNAFKKNISTDEDLDISTKNEDKGFLDSEIPEDDTLTPALSDFSEKTADDPEVLSIASKEVTSEESSFVDSGDGSNDISSEMASRLENFFGEEFDKFGDVEVSEEQVLQGVAVETEADDESDEEALPRYGDTLAPALSDGEEEVQDKGVEKIAGEDQETVVSSNVNEFFTEDEFSPEDAAKEVAEKYSGEDDDIGPALGFLDEKPGFEEDPEAIPSEIEGRPESYFDDDVSPALSEGVEVTEEPKTEPLGNDDEPPSEIMEKLDGFFEEDPVAPVSEDDELALQGVDVEKDADDDSDEEPLWANQGEVTPALSDAIIEDKHAEISPAKEDPSAEIDERVAGLFEEEPGTVLSDDDISALEGVNVETEEDDDSDEEPLPFEGGEVAPALGGFDEEIPTDAVEKDSPLFTSGDDVTERKEENIEEAPVDLVSEDSNENIVTKFIDDEPLGEEQSEELEDRLEDFFKEKSEFLLDEDSELALEGVAVETEADDESDEAPLPIQKGMVAPALLEETEEKSVSGEYEVVAPVGVDALVDFGDETQEDDTLLGEAAPVSEEEPFTTERPSLDKPLSVIEEEVVFEEVTEEPEVVFVAVEPELSDEDMLGAAGVDGENEFFVPQEKSLVSEEVEFEPIDQEDTLSQVGLDEEQDFVENLELPDDEPVLEESWIDAELSESVAETNDDLYSVGNDIQQLHEEVNRLQLQIVNMKKAFKEEIADLREELRKEFGGNL